MIPPSYIWQLPNKYNVTRATVLTSLFPYPHTRQISSQNDHFTPTLPPQVPPNIPLTSLPSQTHPFITSQGHFRHPTYHPLDLLLFIDVHSQTAEYSKFHYLISSVKPNRRLGFDVTWP